MVDLRKPIVITRVSHFFEIPHNALGAMLATVREERTIYSNFRKSIHFLLATD